MSTAGYGRFYALIVWCEPDYCWGCLAVSDDRAKLELLRVRMESFGPFPVRVIETPSLDDDDVERAGQAEAWPEHVAFLNHEARGLS